MKFVSNNRVFGNIASAIVWCLLHGVAVQSNGPGVLHEICLTSTFYGQCPSSQVILMRQAQFGRMRIGRCAKGDIGCVHDVTMYMDSQCSGRESCEVVAIDDGLFALNPCPEDNSPYLEAVYDCIEVIANSEHQRQCNSHGKVILHSAIEGIISRSNVYKRHEDGPLCSYVIEAFPGQVVNVTLFDFGTSAFATSGAYGTCYQYATLKESVTDQPLSVCRGTRREKQVAISKSHRVEIKFNHPIQDEEEPAFLLKYTVIGCADPELNGYIVLERTTAGAILYCESSGVKLTITCDDRQWDRTPGTCAGRTTWNSGIFIVLGVGIMIGMIIGSCLFLCILFCIRKRRERTKRQNMDGYYSTYGHKSVGNFDGNPAYSESTIPRKKLPKDKKDYITTGYDQQAARDATLRKPTNQPYEPVY